MNDKDFDAWLEHVPTAIDGGVSGTPRARVFKVDVITYVADLRAKLAEAEGARDRALRRARRAKSRVLDDEARAVLQVEIESSHQEGLRDGLLKAADEVARSAKVSERAALVHADSASARAPVYEDRCRHLAETLTGVADRLLALADDGRGDP